MLGVIVIDVQKLFVEGAVGDMKPILACTHDVFQWVEASKVPFFITYERSDEGEFALPEALEKALPFHQREFIKSTYDATGLESFSAEIMSSGCSHFLLLGSETDVCVMQTSLGLRKLGFEVLVLKDAVFSCESNTGPALRRMAAAGVSMVDGASAQKWIAGAPLPARVPTGELSIFTPLKDGRANVALVFSGLEEDVFAQSSDPLKEPKFERLCELLLLSEWFDIPCYRARAGEALPVSLVKRLSPNSRRILESKKWRPLNEFLQGQHGQVVIAGAATGAIPSSMFGACQVFVMEDALFTGGEIPVGSYLPLTYKSFFYDMKKSIHAEEWASAAWMDKKDDFLSLLKEPEKLIPYSV